MTDNTLPTTCPAFLAAQQALEVLFGQASGRPDNLTLLRLYALFKQATLGDAPDERPGIGNIKARYKHDAWASLRGMAQGDAEQEYVALADALSNDTPQETHTSSPDGNAYGIRTDLGL